MDIQLIQIMMATNIPNSVPIELTRDRLYHPDYENVKGIGNYPYITDSIDYMDTNLSTLSYPKVVDTFFNKSNFINMMTSFSTKKTNSLETFERNVMTMLRLLLPTKYFVVNNHKQSIKLLNPNAQTSDSSSIFYNPFSTMSSYLKINNKPYTVTEVVWLNDIVTHPIYNKLLIEGYNIQMKRQNEQYYKNNILYKYKSPELTTGNEELQTYINDGKYEDFANIYQHYILKEELSINNNLLQLNVNNINNLNRIDKPTKQIYIKVLVIDGEVTDTNKSDIYCPMTNEQLGSDLVNPISDYAKLLGDQTIFSVKTKKSTVSNSSNGPMQTVTTNINNPSDIFNRDVIENFGRIILTPASKTILQPLIDNIRKNTPSLAIDNTPDSILTFILSSYKNNTRNLLEYTKLPNLPSVINKWNKNTTTRKDTTLADEMQIMESGLVTLVTIIDSKIAASTNQSEKDKLSAHLDIIKLYKQIINLLITNEKTKKIEKYFGGKNKKNKKHKYTKRRTRYITSKSRKRKHR